MIGGDYLEVDKKGISPSALETACPTHNYWAAGKADVESSPCSGSPRHDLHGSARALRLVARQAPNASRLLKAAKVNGRKISLSLPPMLDTSVETRHTFRFRISTAVSSVGVGLGGVLGAMGVVGKVANTSVANIHSCARLIGFRVWLPAVVGSDGFLLDWFGDAGYVPDSAVDSIIPDGITSTGCMAFSPPKNSLASFWLNSQNIVLGTSLFSISGPVGTIIDMRVAGRLSNNVGTSTISVATAAVGTMYYLALDGPGSNKIQPVGLPSTS